MNNQAFLNRLRSLFNIDGDLLPELSAEQQRAFVVDPVRYLMRADDEQDDAIMREVEKRQRHAPIDLTDEMVVAAMEHIPGCDHDAMVDALQAALKLADVRR